MDRNISVNFLLPVFLLAIAAYMEACVIYACVWAGFQGFGDIWLEYNDKGSSCCLCIMLVEPVLLVCFCICKVIKHYRQKEKMRYYIYDILLIVLGISTGIILFCLFPEPRQTILDAIKGYIRDSGWLEYPMP